MTDQSPGGFKVTKEVSLGSLFIVVTMASGMFANWKSLSIGMVELTKDVTALESRMHDNEARVRNLEEGRAETRVILAAIQASLAEIKDDLRKLPK